jgi:hypothetical protein
VLSEVEGDNASDLSFQFLDFLLLRRLADRFVKAAREAKE